VLFLDKPSVVIWCGGTGTRLKEETEYKPKPIVKIGDMPILWHIMKIYSCFGYNDFILCLGYKGEMIKEFFLNYEWMANDFTINLKARREWEIHDHHKKEDWNITFVDTGQETLTAKRLKMVEKYVNKGCPYILATYGDGVGNINIPELVEFHKKMGKIATLTGVHPSSKYGEIKAGPDNVVNFFEEKPTLSDYINGGFFVFDQKLFDLIGENEMIEWVLQKLVKQRQVAMFRHAGFWHCMDTFKDFEHLNKLWNTGNASWKIWK
jgi:glucose-1-phosphate cytidylyltransferase